jgi:hypothetical protein
MVEDKELDAPGPTTAGEIDARGLSPERIPLTAVKLQKLFDHQRWLATGGRAGKRLYYRQIWGSTRKDFTNHDLDGMDFSSAQFVNIFFLQCSLRDVRFTGAQLECVTFLGCDLAGADFRCAKLEDVHFEESNYRQATFDPDTRLQEQYPQRVIRYHSPRHSPKI